MVDEERNSPTAMVRKPSTDLGLQGFGRVDLIESKVVGLKSREVYETPAVLALVEAHQDLERLVLTPSELLLKRYLDEVWTDLVYQGLLIDPTMIHLKRAIDSMSMYVTGVVRLETFKGSLAIVERDSPYSPYSKELVDYNTGWASSGEEAMRFIELLGLYTLAALEIRESAGENRVRWCARARGDRQTSSLPSSLRENVLPRRSKVMKAVEIAPTIETPPATVKLR